jgi:hypothetical protein
MHGSSRKGIGTPLILCISCGVLSSSITMEKSKMKKLTISSWGYWGWGSSAAEFVKGADAVEAARGVNALFLLGSCYNAPSEPLN